MAAFGTLNLTGDDAIIQGSDYARAFQFLDGDGAPVNLDGKSVRGQLRPDFADITGVITATLVCTVVNGPAGIVLVQLTNAVTQAIGTNGVLSGKVDFEAYDASVVNRLSSGVWELSREVTR